MHGQLTHFIKAPKEVVTTVQQKQSTNNQMSNNLHCIQNPSLFACDVSVYKHLSHFSANTTTNLKTFDLLYVCYNLSKLNSR